MMRLLIGVLPFLCTASSSSSRRCRCLPGERCWPSNSDWDTLNMTLNGNLHTVTPLAKPCHLPDFDVTKCSFIRSQSANSSFRAATPGKVSPAVIVDAGVQAYDLNQFCADKNISVVAGYSSTGTLVHANDYQNQDLFWALRGGGGGTFGVVTSATLRTHENPRITTATLQISSPVADEVFWALTQRLYVHLPRINNLGASGLHVTYPNTSMPSSADGSPSQPRALMILKFSLVEREPKEFISELESLSLAFTHTSGSNIRSSGSNFQFNISSVGRLSDYYKETLSGSDHGGVAAALTSRLVSKAFIESAKGPSQIADTFSRIKLSPNEAISGNIVSVRAVADNGNTVSSSIHPAWRRTLSHITIVRGWSSNTTIYEQRKTQMELTHVQGPMLKALKLPGETMSYMNEGNGFEPDFQSSFWGDNYPALSQIKRTWDAQDFFIVQKGVGSERWDDDGICVI
ncbi:hypothetical protein ARSEF1564_009058 [Beauveria bassiana]